MVKTKCPAIYINCLCVVVYLIYLLIPGNLFIITNSITHKIASVPFGIPLQWCLFQSHPVLYIRTYSFKNYNWKLTLRSILTYTFHLCLGLPNVSYMFTMTKAPLRFLQWSDWLLKAFCRYSDWPSCLTVRKKATKTTHHLRAYFSYGRMSKYIIFLNTRRWVN